jgi:hypothetical protein
MVAKPHPTVDGCAEQASVLHHVGSRNGARRFMMRSVWIVLFLLRTPRAQDVVVPPLPSIRAIVSGAGAEVNAKNINHTANALSRFNWSVSPGGSLVGGRPATVTLAPCPIGIDTSANTEAQYGVYISKGLGRAEMALVSGGSCTSGAANGTIIFTPSNNHKESWTIGSATGGIQEAINDADGESTNSVGTVVNLGSTAGSETANYSVYNTIYVKGSRDLILGYGALLRCFTRSACLMVGVHDGFVGQASVIEGIEFQPMLNVDGVRISSVSAHGGVYTITTDSNHPFVTGDYVWVFYSTPSQTQEVKVPIVVSAANQFQYKMGSRTFSSSDGYGWAALESAAIEDSANHVTMRNLRLLEGEGAASFSIGAVIDNDQSAKIDGFTNQGGGKVLKCTANFCGALILARGDQGIAPVLDIQHLEASLQCGGNGVRYIPGNSMSISNSVIQGFSQYGVYYGSGLQPVLLDNVYQESGFCRNPAYPGSLTAQAGIVTNSDLTVIGDAPIGGMAPSFLPQHVGLTQKNYYVVIRSSAVGNMGMYYVGKCLTTGLGSCAIEWPAPALDGMGKLTFDLLVTVGSNATPPYGSTAASVAVDITSGTCSTNGICEFVDPQRRTAPYILPTPIVNRNPRFNFWPGAIVLGNGSHVSINRCGQGSMFVTSTTTPSVFCNFGLNAGSRASYTPHMMVFNTGDSSGNNNPSVGATLKQSGPSTGSMASGEKGLYNFINPYARLGQTDILTFADSDPLKTVATPGYRPSWDAADTAAGFYSAGGTTQAAAKFYLRAPGAIGFFINTLPTGTPSEELTSTLKTFTVPLKINKPIISTLANGVAPLVITSQTRVSNLTTGGNDVVKNCGAAAGCANTLELNSFVVHGKATLKDGILSYSGLPFVSMDWTCTTSDLTTGRNGSRMTQVVDSTHATIVGTGSDVIAFICTGR